MRTPSGRECAFYYEDFNRGSDIQECRARKDPRTHRWDPSVCALCPVPDILMANGSPWLEITIRIRRRPLLGTKVSVVARCTKHDLVLSDPMVGCPRDFEDMPEF